MNFRSHSSRELTAEQKLLAVLRMIACGNFQQTAADYIGIAQTTVAKILPSVKKMHFIHFLHFYPFFSIPVIKVCDAILLHFHEFVRMPQTENERLVKAAAFAEIADFPRCIGAIDCTHIRMFSPGGDIVSVSYTAFHNKLHRFTLVLVLLPTERGFSQSAWVLFNKCANHCRCRPPDSKCGGSLAWINARCRNICQFNGPAAARARLIWQLRDCRRWRLREQCVFVYAIPCGKCIECRSASVSTVFFGSIIYFYCFLLDFVLQSDPCNAKCRRTFVRGSETPVPHLTIRHEAASIGIDPKSDQRVLCFAQLMHRHGRHKCR